MTFDRAFAVGLAWRVVLLVLLLAALVYLATSGYRAPTIVAWMAVVGLIGSLWVYVQRTNMELARFVEALNYADFSQSFGHKREGLGFDELGASMNAAVAKLREERARAQDSNRTLAALVDEVPTPLLGLHVDGRIDLLNKAARRMFSAKPVTHVQDLAGYGSALAEAVERTPIAERRIVELEVDEAPQRATLSVAEVRPAGGEPLRVLAIQPIQNELDQVEMSTWRDLVRVLTHEIMNSVTPITSLSKTAAELIAEADDGRSEVLADARAAVETVARRADGVMHFVQTYRQITRSPPLRRQTIRLAALFDELRRLFRADWPVETAGLEVGVEPAGLELFADPDLIAQLLINLLRNGAEAAVGHAERPRLSLTAHRNRQGRAVIEVSDNGPGVPPDKVDEIFLPFFTTKATGTGVGLSLARQVALAHGGSLTYLPNDAGGATFRIVI